LKTKQKTSYTHLKRQIGLVLHPGMAKLAVFFLKKILIQLTQIQAHRAIPNLRRRLRLLLLLKLQLLNYLLNARINLHQKKAFQVLHPLRFNVTQRHSQRETLQDIRAKNPFLQFPIIGQF